MPRAGGRTHATTLPIRAGAPPTARDTGPTARVRRLVYLRCGADLGPRGRILEPGWCEWPGCWSPRTDLHHRLNRKTGGRHGDRADELNQAAWLLATCRDHHQQVTSPSAAQLVEARAMGWLLREHEDALLVPVLTRHHPVPVLLDNDGGWACDEGPAGGGRALVER